MSIIVNLEILKRESELLKLNKASKFFILVLGPYWPECVLKRLEKIVKTLQKMGWANTCLVKDLDDSFAELDDAHRKSFYYIKEAHAVVALFPIEGEKQGVAIEACKILDDALLSKKSFLVLEVDDNNPEGYMTTLLSTRKEFSTIARARVSINPNDDDDVKNKKIIEKVHGYLKGSLLKKKE